MWRSVSFGLAVVLLMAWMLLAQDDIIHLSTQLVTVTVSVTDKNGRPITEMKRDDFTILDDGRPRAIQSLSQDLDVPLTLGLVADNTGSQRRFIQKHRSDLRQFLRQVLQPADQAFLVSIQGPAWLVADVTDSQDELAAATNITMRRRSNRETFGGDCPPYVPFGREGCGSLIWNGVWASAKLRLHNERGRKAILLLSDGQDTGSEHTLTETIEAAQGADAPVYTVASPAHPAGLHLKIAAGYLERLSNETGGGYFRVSPDLSETFAQIEAELRHLYVLTFKLPEEDRDGKFHKLEVKSSRPGVKLRARAGYVAQ